MMERSLVVVKPDGVQRGLVGEIIKRMENRGLRMVGAKFMKVSKELAEKHYAIHKGKPFYEPLLLYITSAPVMAMVWEGPNVVIVARQTMGSTKPFEAAPGTIRADFALTTRMNLVHGSDNPENAEKVISMWFSPDELVEWNAAFEPWIYEL
jgi:nucleoside-diphosphate kinase